MAERLPSTMQPRSHGHGNQSGNQLTDATEEHMNGTQG
jgi:hypothetical protein